jgi:hypothetical protein
MCLLLDYLLIELFRMLPTWLNNMIDQSPSQFHVASRLRHLQLAGSDEKLALNMAGFAAAVAAS